MGLESEVCSKGYVMIQSVVSDGIYVYSHDHGSIHLFISISKMFVEIWHEEHTNTGRRADGNSNSDGNSTNIFVQGREWNPQL